MRFSYVALASSVSLVLLTIILTPVPYKNSCYLHDSPISTSNGVYIAGSLSPPIQSYFHVPLLIHDSPTLPSLYNLLSVAPRPSRSGGSLTYSKTLDSWQLKLGTSQVVAASGKYLDPNDPPSWLPKITLSCDSQLTNEAYPYISPYSLGQRNKQTGTSNLSEITSHPTTFSILLINVLVFVYAYNPANNVSPSSMTTSYAAVITDRETYRMMYSSFSHGDLLHLGFNSMTLYSLIELETAFSPFVYLTLSLSLVFVTSVVALLLTHCVECLQAKKVLRCSEVSATLRGQQQSLGYSGVLFALITYATLLLPEYAPIPFVPSLSFETYVLPKIGLRVNGAPFCLLVVTQFVLKRASFLGHLSGIVAGYALSWIGAGPWLSLSIWLPTTFILDVVAQELLDLPWFLPRPCSKEQVRLESAEDRVLRAFLYLQWGMTALGLFLKVLDYSTLVSQKIAWFHLLLYCKGRMREGGGGRYRVLRMFALSCCGLIVLDLILLGSVIGRRDYLQASCGLEVGPAVGLVLCKLAINSVCLVASARIVEREGVDCAVCRRIGALGWGRRGGEEGGEEVEMTPFMGRGQATGTTSTSTAEIIGV